LWVLWGIVNLVPKETTQGSLQQLGPLSPTLTSLVIAWSLSEIIRYGFFAAKVLGVRPHFQGNNAK
jgi:very-long-chain (3R)-3-hydroxyacyl-CoA dehydratase